MKQRDPWTPEWASAVMAGRTPAGRCLFLSDLHLGAGPDRMERLRDLDALLDSLPGAIDDLVLGGDIFDFWWEWKHAVPRGHLPFLLSLRRAAERGVRLHIVAGNHDFAVGSFLQGFLPARVDPDGYCLEIGTRRWILVHGDAMAESDRVDRLVKRVLRSRWAHALWNLVPPDLAFSMASGVGATSRTLQPGPAPNLPEYLESARHLCRSLGLAGFVHGHTHRPLLVHHDDGTYVNNGDWVKDRSCVWIDEHGTAQLLDCRKDGHPWLSNT